VLFSAFTPVDLYELSGATPIAERIYDSLISGLGGQYSPDGGPPPIGSRQEALCYMQALQIARARQRLHEARDQRLPSKVVDLLPVRETEYGLVPGPNDTIAQRQAAFAARKLLPKGGTKTNLIAALTALLGSDFVTLYVNPINTALNFPVTCGAWPQNLQRADAPRKIVKLTSPVDFIGTAKTVSYTTLPTPLYPLGAQAEAIVAGDVVVFDTGSSGQIDRVNVTGATVIPSFQGVSPNGTISGTLTANFTRPHESGSMGYVGDFPLWLSPRRHMVVFVSAAAAADPERKRKVHDLMSRMVKATTTWAITASMPGSPNVSTQWQLGVPGLGYTTLTQLTA